MYQEIAQDRFVIQNGNPFEDALRLFTDRPVQTVVDVGANVGDVCDQLLAAFPHSRVHAFEPHEESFQTLRQRFADNERVKTIAMGVSDTNGTETLNLYESAGFNSVLKIDDKAEPFLEGIGGSRPLGTQQFQSIRLDDYCESEGIEEIDFLKLDVQGWELHCLSGASSLLRRGRIRCIYTEVLFAKLYEQQVYYEDIASYLRTFGYGLFNLYALSFNKDRQLCWADANFFR